MDGRRKATGNLEIFGFFLLLGLACPMLLAQTEGAKPVSKAASEFVIQVSNSLETPVPGESIVHAAERLAGWKECKGWASSKGIHLTRDWPRPEGTETGIIQLPETYQTPVSVRSLGADPMPGGAGRRLPSGGIARTFDVYQGQLFIGVAPITSREGTRGLGPVAELQLVVANISPESRTVNIKLSCGSWSQSQYLRIPPNVRYVGANTPLGQPMLIYTPGPDCTLETLQLDTLQRDIS